MTTTATWSTATLPAHKLAAGDRIDLDGRTLTLMEAVDAVGFVSIVGEDPDVYVVQSMHPDVKVTVHVPDEPVDRYNLWKPTTSPLGCTCLSRRGQDGNWATIATDPDCRWCNQQDWED